MASSNEIPSKAGKGKMKKIMSREEQALKYKTFIGNKAEGQGFADKRKRQVLYNYRKMESKEKEQMDKWTSKLEKIYADPVSDDDELLQPRKKRKVKDNDSTKVEKTERPEDKQKNSSKAGATEKQKLRDSESTHKMSVFHKEEKQQLERKVKKEEKRIELEAQAKARQDGQVKYQKEKRRKNKLLSKKNFKGQPNMSTRMDILLEKIVRQVST